MYASSEYDKSDPSLFGVVFFASLFALIGALAGFAVLASISPEPFESVAEYESDRNGDSEAGLLNPHYFRRPKSVFSGWIEKREILLTASDTTVELTDAELNAWVAKRFRKPQADFSKENRPKISVLPGLPNFFIGASEGFTFSLPLEIVVFGKQYNYFLIGRGYFSGEDPVQFQLNSLRLNEAVIPLSPKLNDRFMDPLLEAFSENDEFIAIREAWEKVESVELVENRIRLNLD